MQDLLDRLYLRDADRNWLSRLDGILDLIDQHRDKSDRDGITSPDIISVMLQLGLHRMWVSRSFGGHQLDPSTGTAILRTIAKHDASVAWQFGVQGAIGRLSDYLAEHIAHQIFDPTGSLVVGSVNPLGRAEAVADGYRLTGEWAFASGSHFADWLVCGAVVTERGQPKPAPAGGFETVMLFLPKSDCEILQTWNSLGLRATGSNHYTVSDQLVRSEFSVAGSAMAFAPPARASRGYGISYQDFGPLTSSSTALGIAEDALETVSLLAKGKTAAASSSILARSHTVQDRIGRATAALVAARLLLVNAVQSVESLSEGGGDHLSAMIRLSASAIAERALTVVTYATEIGGSTGVYATSRLERCLRDIHTATKHITLSSSHFEMVGQYILGGPLSMRR